MAFDINRYENDVFHEVEEINNRIKVLLLWFEYQVDFHELDSDGQVSLIDNVLKLCVKQEWFEIAAFFKDKKLKIGK